MRRVTKENLIAQIDRLYKIKDEQGQLSMNGEYTLQAYKMLLATMEAEPVFTLEVERADYKGQKLGNHFGFITLDAARELKEGNYQLYTAQPAPVVPEEMLCDFYEVNNWTDLVRELVKHVEQLQDSARRNVKPWEDTFPETLLPAYIERIKLADEACRAAMLNRK